MDSGTSVLPLPPPPPPPVPPTFFVPNSAEVGEALPLPPPPGMSATPQVADIIIPPPPDLQPIVDKLANYVAKNGPDFESIIKAKSDPRFEFLNPWNSHYSYYQFKKQHAVKAVSQRIETGTVSVNCMAMIHFHTVVCAVYLFIAFLEYIPVI